MNKIMIVLFLSGMVIGFCSIGGVGRGGDTGC